MQELLAAVALLAVYALCRAELLSSPTIDKCCSTVVMLGMHRGLARGGNHLQQVVKVEQ